MRNTRKQRGRTMTKGTFWLVEQPDGGIKIGIEDYGVEAFWGGDYEWSYTLDRGNREKLTGLLLATHKGSLEQMITAEFGVHLDKKSVMQWMNENGIEYRFFSNLS